MRTVDGQICIAGLEHLEGGRINIHIGHARFLRSQTGSIRIGRQARVMIRALGQVGIARVFKRDGAEKHQSGEGFSVGLCGANGSYHIYQASLIVGGFINAVIRFIVTKERKDHVSTHMAQIV